MSVAMKQGNRMELRFLGISQNEGFARVCAGAFAAQLDPTMDEIQDIKTAISEAVTNAIIHAYPDATGEVVLRGALEGNLLRLEVEDFGQGIPDVAKAREPFYTTCANEERSGMGFTVMETFMDRVKVESVLGQGTIVRMEKKIGQAVK